MSYGPNPEQKVREMGEKATEQSLRINLRRKRAMSLVAAILQQINPYLKDDGRHRRDAHDALMRVFVEEGVEVLTDHVRMTLGLSPRGPDGWTDEEIRALDLRRLELLLDPPKSIILKATP